MARIKSRENTIYCGLWRVEIQLVVVLPSEKARRGCRALKLFLLFFFCLRLVFGLTQPRDNSDSARKYHHDRNRAFDDHKKRPPPAKKADQTKKHNDGANHDTSIFSHHLPPETFITFPRSIQLEYSTTKFVRQENYLLFWALSLRVTWKCIYLPSMSRVCASIAGVDPRRAATSGEMIHCVIMTKRF